MCFQFNRPFFFAFWHTPISVSETKHSAQPAFLQQCDTEDDVGSGNSPQNDVLSNIGDVLKTYLPFNVTVRYLH